MRFWDSSGVVPLLVRQSISDRMRALYRADPSLITWFRGGTVDEAAMTRALQEGWIAGAGLDVLAEEPPAPGHALLGLRNVLLTPHTAGHGVEAMEDNRQQSIDEVVRFLRGEWPRTIVNPEVKPHARARSRMRD